MSDEPSRETPASWAFSNMLWRGVCAGHWGTEDLSNRARGILQTSALVIAAITVGIIGVSQAYGVDLTNIGEVDRASLGMPIPILSLGSGGMGAMLAAMLFSAVALGVHKVSSLVRYSDFTSKGDAEGEIDDAVLGRFARMSGESMDAMHRAHINAIRDLQKNNAFVAKFVIFGQWSLFAGIFTVAMLAVFLLVHMIRSVALA
ncbi:MAG: hypothetical protein OXD41_04985 [Thaumarchaeota archaeon]|nr:hypothetical protein [Nitrososphaerota archaeon]MDD9843756.1 hypothetical protein [Nitrososphaerota archaeon]